MPLITRAARDYELISGYINTRGYTAVELGRAAKLSWRSLVISRPLTCVMNRMVIRRTCVFEEAGVRRSNQLDTYQETRACARRNPLGGFRAVRACVSSCWIILLNLLTRSRAPLRSARRAANASRRPD